MIISALDYESLFLNTKRAHRQEHMEHRKKMIATVLESATATPAPHLFCMSH